LKLIYSRTKAGLRRHTRQVGLGLPLPEAATQRYNGDLQINSTPGKGTKDMALFGYHHPERVPMSYLALTMASLITSNGDVAIIYSHIFCFVRDFLSESFCRLEKP
jgi:hypothetical protein